MTGEKNRVQRTPIPLYTPLSPPGGFLRSDETVDIKAILDPVRESKEKRGGEKFSPVFSDQPVFSPDTPVTPLVIDPDDYGPINGVWGGPLCRQCFAREAPVLMTEDRVYESQDLFDDYGKLNHHVLALLLA